MSFADFAEKLDSRISGQVLLEERLSRHTSYRIGGPAALFITVDNYTDLHITVEMLSNEQIPWVVLGKGSNILASDSGYDGAVIILGGDFRKSSFNEKTGLTVAGAGTSLARLVQDCLSKNLSGLEFAIGVPGTVGGATSMNAGSRKEWIGSVISSVVCYRPGEGLVRYSASDIQWYYRATTIPPREIILEVEMDLTPASHDDIRGRMETRLSKRKRSQPLNKPSCGSVFKNPVNYSAGELIENCGLKEYSFGKASISEMHANFIINNGNATATDVAHVIVKVRNKVKEVHGVELQPEVKFLGFPSQATK